MNNSERRVTIKTYNESDALHWVPYQTLTVAPDDVVRLQARGENFINVYLDDASFKPQVGKSYIFDGLNLGKQS